jgi:hypothetical protein
MKMKMTGGPRVTVRDELHRVHRALWSTYLRLDKEVPGGPQSLEDALTVLAECRMREARPALDMALWNLLGAYEKDKPPVVFEKMLNDVVAVNLDRAQSLRQTSPHADFPPFDSPLIIDASFSSDEKRASITLSFEKDFDDLAVNAEPQEWPRICPLFWQRVEPDGDNWIGWLRDPAGGEGDELKVHLETKRSSVNATEAIVDFTITPEDPLHDRIEGGALHFAMAPETRPGWTRIQHSREITFGKEVPRKYRKPTLSYWIQSEIACLIKS